MPELGLVACCAGKRPHPCRAGQIYISPLFRMSLEWLERVRGVEEVRILSAKHGLLDPAELIGPYDETLSRMRAPERRAWTEGVADQLREGGFLEGWGVVALAGDLYLRDLRGVLEMEEPLAGKQIGKRLQWLRGELST